MDKNNFERFKERVILRKDLLNKNNFEEVYNCEKFLKDSFPVYFKKYFLISIDDFKDQLIKNCGKVSLCQGKPVVDSEGYLVQKDGKFVNSGCEVIIKENKGLRQYILPVYDEKQNILIPLFECDKDLNNVWREFLINNPNAANILWKIVKNNFNKLNERCRRILPKMIKENRKQMMILDDDWLAEKAKAKLEFKNDDLKTELKNYKEEL